MDREEKLLIMYGLTAFFALLFHSCTTNERMAKAGYLPHRLEGDTAIYWFMPEEKKLAKQQLLTF